MSFMCTMHMFRRDEIVKALIYLFFVIHKRNRFFPRFTTISSLWFFFFLLSQDVFVWIPNVEMLNEKKLFFQKISIEIRMLQNEIESQLHTYTMMCFFKLNNCIVSASFGVENLFILLKLTWYKISHHFPSFDFPNIMYLIIY